MTQATVTVQVDLSARSREILHILKVLACIGNDHPEDFNAAFNVYQNLTEPQLTVPYKMICDYEPPKGPDVDKLIDSITQSLKSKIS